MNTSTPNLGESRSSTLATLRRLVPERAMTFQEALRLAELQAARLLELSDVDETPVPSEVVLRLPRIRVRYHQLSAASGMTYWNGLDWIIGINSAEPLTRQRFTLLHEYKHIVDHGRADRLYVGDRRRSAAAQAELAADYFAGCVLMPKRLLKQAWFSGTQGMTALAAQFEVSTAAIAVRLDQLGLRDRDMTPAKDGMRRSLPVRPRSTYLRSLAPDRIAQEART